MIDLNHGSGCNYGQDAPRPPIATAVSSAIDAALTARNRAERPRTFTYLSLYGSLTDAVIANRVLPPESGDWLAGWRAMAAQRH